jgi:hypothetical protein
MQQGRLDPSQPGSFFVERPSEFGGGFGVRPVEGQTYQETLSAAVERGRLIEQQLAGPLAPELPQLDARAAAIALKNAMTGRGRLQADFGTEQDIINLTDEFAGTDIPLQNYLLTRLGDAGPDFRAYVGEQGKERRARRRRLLKLGYEGGTSLGRQEEGEDFRPFLPPRPEEGEATTGQGEGGLISIGELPSASAQLTKQLGFDEPVLFSDFARTKLPGFAADFHRTPAGKKAAEADVRSQELERRELLRQRGRTVVRT